MGYTLIGYNLFLWKKYMKKLIAIVGITLVLFGCSSSKDAREALQKNGFTDIETHGYSFFGCTNDDTFKTKWTATNTQGVKVSGVACSGWFKGTTLRF